VCSVASCTPILIQQHINASSISFNRSWDEYKHGFGDTEGNYWIGNNVLTWLTENGKYMLKFDLQSRRSGKWFYAEYSTFVVLPEAQNYKLQVAGYKGNAGKDSFSKHSEMMFTTYDRDNDQWSSGNCAVPRGDGFWYKRCDYCAVNSDGITTFYWSGLPGGQQLQASRMWLLCK